jgi:hypothetical protein
LVRSFFVSTLENLSLTSAEQKTNRMRGWMGDVTIGKSSRDQDDGHNVAWRSGRVGHRDCAL